MTRQVNAEWDHVATAVEVGSLQAECAVVRMEDAGEGERRFEIKHVTGRRGVVSAKTAPGGEASKPTDIELSCAFGPTADEELSRRVLTRIRHRLEDLRGKSFAPIRE